MTLNMYQVDAFASTPFTGNPAAVVPLQNWLPDSLMQLIALENNLSETAFFVPEGSGYLIRWFTPTAEVRLCGHATLATAFVIASFVSPGASRMVFDSLSGELRVEREGERYYLDFPAQPPVRCDDPEAVRLFGPDAEVYGGDDYLLVLSCEADVMHYIPDMAALKTMTKRGLIITAPGKTKDFVCRFFAPAIGIDEDPVTGSAFTRLIPYWNKRLGKTTMQARQVSNRGGDVACEIRGERVRIGGEAVLYLRGEITV